MTAAIVQFQKKQEAKFLCSACGADRACDCNAPAVEKLAEMVEQRRRADRAYKERKRQQKQQSGDIADDESIEDDVSPKHYRDAFLIRADQARQFAVYSGPIAKDVVAMARQVAKAWSTLADKLEQSL